MFIYYFILLMKNDEKYANNKVNDKYFRSVHHLNLLNLFEQINSFTKTYYE